MADKIRVMPQLDAVLKEYTKSVIRDMPEDVIAYSKEYFVEKAQQLRMDSYQLEPSKSKVFHELSADMKDQVEAVFKRYDIDMDGGLTVDEVNTMLADLGGLFGFSSDVNGETLMALLDVDGDRHISWQVGVMPPCCSKPGFAHPPLAHTLVLI